jgi:hypothetical protein
MVKKTDIIVKRSMDYKKPRQLVGIFSQKPRKSASALLEK